MQWANGPLSEAKVQIQTQDCKRKQLTNQPSLSSQPLKTFISPCLYLNFNSLIILCCEYKDSFFIPFSIRVCQQLRLYPMRRRGMEGEEENPENVGDIARKTFSYLTLWRFSFPSKTSTFFVFSQAYFWTPRSIFSIPLTEWKVCDISLYKSGFQIVFLLAVGFLCAGSFSKGEKGNNINRCVAFLLKLLLVLNGSVILIYYTAFSACDKLPNYTVRSMVTVYTSRKRPLPAAWLLAS